MANTIGPKIAVVDSIPDGATYGNDGRAFLRMYQALIQPNVINMTTAAAPGTPSNGDTYVVASVGSGAWTGKTNFVAYWSTDNPLTPSGEWEFYQPINGWTVGDQNTGFTYKYNGATWVQLPVGVTSLNSGTGASSSTFWRGDGSWAAAGAATFSTAGSAMFYPGINLPGYVNLNGNFAAAATSNAVGVLPLVLTASYTVRKIANQVRSGLNSANGVCAVYSADGNTKLIDSGANAFNLNSSSTQVVTLGSPVVLAAGEYLFAWGATSGSGTLANAGFYLDAVTPALYNAGTSGFVATAANAISAGAMPATLGTLTGTTNITNVPMYLFIV
jgi:hypothetical protein